MSTDKQTESFLAIEFVTFRLDHYKKLFIRVKKLILEIVEYYLTTFYPFDNEACDICLDIEIAKKDNNEELMVACYKRFLEFLPIKLRSGIQGKNLFRQPTDSDLILAHFYPNEIDQIKEFNKMMFNKDDNGMTNQDRVRLAEILDADIHLEI